jgi:rRNA maturation endonuclease Nob1
MESGKWRLTRQDDRYNVIQCLDCKGAFVLGQLMEFKYCPYCGVKFDGPIDLKEESNAVPAGHKG